MNRNIKIAFFTLILCAAMFTSCKQPHGNSTGSEYMPDMGHSVAYEANVYNYYYNNTWDNKSVKKLKELSIPGLPVANTIPRGYAGVHYASTGTAKNAMMKTHNGYGNENSIAIPVNGSVPYYYADTEEERTRASNEIIHNPFPITKLGLEQGKELYDINCGICHGDKGDGNGYLVAEENLKAAYPAQPANFLQGDLLTASNGRYYHAVIYGKNVMGGYTDKLSYEERWNVIHYIRSLQAKSSKLVYNEEVNTFNTVDVPGMTVTPIADEMGADHHSNGHDQEGEGHHHEGDGHGHDADGHDHENHDGDHGHDHGDHSGEDHSHEGEGHGDKKK